MNPIDWNELPLPAGNVRFRLDEDGFIEFMRRPDRLHYKWHPVKYLHVEGQADACCAAIVWFEMLWFAYNDYGSLCSNDTDEFMWAVDQAYGAYESAKEWREALRQL